MIKQAKYTFVGANQDISKEKHPFQFYYEAQHIKLLATDSQSSEAVANEKGNELVITLPSITIADNRISYGPGLNFRSDSDLQEQIDNGEVPTSSPIQVIIGHTTTRDSIILFSTDDSGMNCIWEVRGVLTTVRTLHLLYLRNMNFQSTNPIQALFNYENENIQKIYWVDGLNQIRFLNIKQDDIINTPLNTINFVGDFDLSQPYITELSSGGSHTAGMVQYGYNLYRLNSSQTKLSPLSDLVPLSKGEGLGGGQVNEVVSTTPVVKIDNIDTEYTHLRLYAIRYTSLDQTPSIELIDERELGGNTSISVYDDGSSIGTLSLEELLFLGSDPVIPKHIAVKDNVLFPINIREEHFDMPDTFDARAYSWPSAGPAFVIISTGVISASGLPVPGSSGVISVSDTTFSIPKTFDSVNPNYKNQVYQTDRTTRGGEGKYIKYEIVQKSLDDPEDYRVFKDGEIYRIGIEFYNKLGQKSLPYWIADFKAPVGNLSGNYNTLKVTLKPEFYTWLNSLTFENENDRPVGFKVLRANRTLSDRTIISQGLITPMIFQVKGENVREYEKFRPIQNRQLYQDGALKMPSYLTRVFEKIPTTASGANNGVLQTTSHLKWLNDFASGLDEGGEIYTVTERDAKISQTFQYTKMMQQWSPEILFDTITQFPADTQLRVIGHARSTSNGVYAEERFIETKLTKFGGRSLGGINPHHIDESNYIENNDFWKVFDTPESSGSTTNNHRFIGPSGGGPELTMNFYHYYRQFNNFISSPSRPEYPIYGVPEITPRGAESRFYNNDPTLNYTNSLVPFTSDGENDCDTCDPIISVNSFGGQCTTIVLQGANTNSRPSIEEIKTQATLVATDGVVSTEIVRKKGYEYIGGIYGGNSYEDKKRTNYLAIGEYTPVGSSTVSVQIDNPGDTYVQNFRMLRIAKTDTEIYDHTQAQITEIIEFPVETTIDLKNRHDISLSSWDARFQPRYDEYHGYNSVYSQQPTLVISRDVDFNFQRVEAFDARITATKSKIPNELIDSWTDMLVNEFRDLDGSYGPINAVVNYDDEIFTLQDKALAQIIINPRTQVQSTSGLDIELGKGSLLYDHKYLTNKSGSINKWGVVPTRTGFYYYDALNRGVYKYPEFIKTSLSDAKGLHTFFNNNFIYDMLVVDNPVYLSSAVLGYDNYNGDIYISLLQADKTFTWCYNEKREQFIDLKQYLSSWYINIGPKLLLSNPGNTALYEQEAGEYNKFFGNYVPSYITLLLNPQTDLDTIFNNIFFRSEVYLNDIDQPDKTLTHIQAYNEYQDSGRIPLIVGRSTNLRRKFRQWKADIPRQESSRARLRNPWIFLKLEFDNNSNYKLILHDIQVIYTNY